MSEERRIYQNFTPMQKLIVLCLITAAWSATSWSLVALGAFVVGLSLSRVVSRRLLSVQTYVKAFYVLQTINFLEQFVAKAKSFFVAGRHNSTIESKGQNAGRAFATFELPSHDANPEEEARLMVRYICRDFVKNWYCIVSDDETFIEKVQELLEDISLDIFKRLRGVNLNVIVQTFIKSYHRHLSDYQESFVHWKNQPVFRRKYSPNRTHVKKVKDEAEAFRQLGKFHFAMQRDEEFQLLYLRSVVEILMKVLLPEKIYDCSATKELLQEILTCNVLLTILDLVSDPCWLHQAIILITSQEESNLGDDYFASNEAVGGDKHQIVGPECIASSTECYSLSEHSNPTDIHLPDHAEGVTTNELQDTPIYFASEIHSENIHCVENQHNSTLIFPSVDLIQENPAENVSNLHLLDCDSERKEVEGKVDIAVYNVGNPLHQGPVLSQNIDNESETEATEFQNSVSVDTISFVPDSPSKTCVVEPEKLAPGSPLVFKVFSEESTEKDCNVTLQQKVEIMIQQIPPSETADLCSSTGDSDLVKGKIDFNDKHEIGAGCEDASGSSSIDTSETQSMFVSSELSKYFIIQSMGAGHNQSVTAASENVQSVESDGTEDMTDVNTKFDNNVDSGKLLSVDVDVVSENMKAKLRSTGSSKVTDVDIHKTENESSLLHSSDFQRNEGNMKDINDCANMQVQDIQGGIVDSMMEEMSGREHRGHFKPKFFFDQEEDASSIFSDVSASSGGSADAQSLRGSRLSPEGASLYLSSPDLFQAPGKHASYPSSRELSPEPNVYRSSPVSTLTREALNCRRHSDPLIGGNVESISSSPPPPYSQISSEKEPDCLFTDISIPETETLREPGGGGAYTIYIIQYKAWHKQQSSGLWVQHASVVKRRYREFVTLQDRLEEHSLYRKSMKYLKGPRKWPSLPMSRLKQTKVESRRIFLERYLQALSEKTDLSHSMALREFMAYEGDARLAFVRKAPEMPRLDLVLARTFSGMFNKISSALPNKQLGTQTVFPSREHQQPRRHKVKTLPDFEKWEDPHDFGLTFEMLHESGNQDSWTMENVLVQTVSNYQHKCDSPEDESDDNSGLEGENSEFHDAVEEELLIRPPRSAGDGSDATGIQHGQPSCDIPLASCVLDLAVQTAQNVGVWVCEERVLHIVRIVAGKALEEWLEKQIVDLTTVESCARYIQLLRDTLWPNGELDTAPASVKSESDKVEIRNQAKDCLMKFLPGVLPVVVGQDEFSKCIDEVLASLEHPKLNRHFAFRLLDIVVEACIPEVRTAHLQHQLLLQHGEGGI